MMDPVGLGEKVCKTLVVEGSGWPVELSATAVNVALKSQLWYDRRDKSQDVWFAIAGSVLVP